MLKEELQNMMNEAKMRKHDVLSTEYVFSECRKAASLGLDHIRINDVHIHRLSDDRILTKEDIERVCREENLRAEFPIHYHDMVADIWWN